MLAESESRSASAWVPETGKIELHSHFEYITFAIIYEGLFWPSWLTLAKEVTWPINPKTG